MITPVVSLSRGFQLNGRHAAGQMMVLLLVLLLLDHSQSRLLLLLLSRQYFAQVVRPIRISQGIKLKKILMRILISRKKLESYRPLRLSMTYPRITAETTKTIAQINGTTTYRTL